MSAREDKAAGGRVQVFFDGACPVCRREVGVYRRKDRAGRIEWVDIAGARFEAGAYGLDPERVHAVMHARTPDGAVHMEVEAFRAIWRALPASFLARVLLAVTGWPGVRRVAGWGYRIFARNRYWLTGRWGELKPGGRGGEGCAGGACFRKL